MPDRLSIFSRAPFDLSLNLVERCNTLYGLRAHRTEVVLDQFIELSACVRETSCADAALLLEDLLVHPVPVGYQRARPALEEFKRVLCPSAKAKFIHHAG